MNSKQASTAFDTYTSYNEEHCESTTATNLSSQSSAKRFKSELSPVACELAVTPSGGGKTARGRKSGTQKDAESSAGEAKSRAAKLTDEEEMVKKKRQNKKRESFSFFYYCFIVRIINFDKFFFGTFFKTLIIIKNDHNI